MAVTPDQVKASLSAALVAIQKAIDDFNSFLAISAPPAPPVTPAPTVDQDNAFTFTGTWQAGSYTGAWKGGDKYSSNSGDTATCKFVGTTITVFGAQDAHHGTATCTIDGRTVSGVWKSTTRKEMVVVLTLTGLAPATSHTLKIVVNGDGPISLDGVQSDGVVAPPTQPAPQPPAPPAAPGALRVAKVGSYQVLVDSNGKVWRGLGLNQYMDSYISPGDMTPVSNWVVSNRDKIAAELAGLGCNVVAIPINNSLDQTYMARLKQVVDAFWAKGIRSTLRPFGGIAWAPSAATGNLAADVWSALGKPTYVMLSTVNEPNPRAYSDTPADWLSGTRACIQAMRAKGYTQPIFVDCRGWSNSIPVNEAKQLAAQDSQLVFVSHRYAYNGSSIQGSSDAQTWVNEWKSAAQQGLAIGVEEYGWYNDGGDPSSIQNWCKPMADVHVTGFQEGWMCFCTAWMLLWDQNSMIRGANTGGGYDQISRGEPWVWNEWGKVVQGEWARVRALPVA